MNLQQILDKIIFSIGDYNTTIGNILVTALALLLLVLLHQLAQRRWIPAFFESQEVEASGRRKIRRTVNLSIMLAILLGLVLGLTLNPVIYANEDFTFHLSSILSILLAWQLARLADQMFSHLLTRNFQRRRQEAADQHVRVQLPSETKVYHLRTVQYLVYLFALFILINIFGIDRSFTVPLGERELTLSISDFLVAAGILLIARLLIWILIQLILYPYYRRKEINIGSQFAINQLLRYVLFTIAVLIALQSLGIQMTLIWGGAAALLVGVGLGLQQTFNDFFSGLVLLFERSVEVGDVVNIGGLIGTVRRIGLRASHVQTVDNITVIVPNSKLVVDNVVNWSHNDNRARFHITVGVAYGSDTEKVRDLLVLAAQQHEKILNFPRPFVRFIDFGNSSLDFELHFWTKEFIRIEDVKSDLRFAIDAAFRENDVTIPFPQRDVWFKNPLHQENGQAPASKAPSRPKNRKPPT